MVNLGDEQVGRQVYEWRLQRNMTQADVAQALTEVGCPMHQQTVLKIEKGTRSLKLTEAVYLAEVLQVPVRALYVVDDETRQVHVLESLAADVRLHSLAAAEDMIRCDEALARLQAALSDAPEAVTARAHDSVSLIAELTLDQVVNRTVEQLRSGESFSG